MAFGDWVAVFVGVEGRAAFAAVNRVNDWRYSHHNDELLVLGGSTGVGGVSLGCVGGASIFLPVFKH
jgi:hypothetical protein